MTKVEYFIMNNVKTQANEYIVMFDKHPNDIDDGLKLLTSTIKYFDNEIAPMVIAEKKRAIDYVKAVSDKDIDKMKELEKIPTLTSVKR